jgi:hypothetical protein
MRAGRDDQQRDQGVDTAMAITDHSCLCAACLAARGERRCPDCDTVVPASWARCWPCEQERQAALLAIQRYWTS